VRPADAVLSEEAVDDRRRLSAQRVWIVDPLDGTREYGEPGRPDWAVHVALWAAGALTAAAVALPALGQVLVTEPAPRVPGRPGDRLRIAVSRTRPPAQAGAAATALDAELVPLGSAGYKVSAVVLGDVDAYVHAGGMYQWDSAAPVAVAQAAGLWASRLDGSALRYNQPDPSLPDLLVCRPELAETILTAVAGTR
jgi:3'(2'), 5'-bisphosphate nucleotidase